MIGNLKTAYKIIGYGILLTFIIVIVGFTGYYYNTKSARSLQEMYANNLIAVQVLNDNRNQMRAAESDTVQLLSLQDFAHRANLTADIEKRLKMVEANFAAYEKTGLDDEEKLVLATVKKQLDEYLVAHSQMLKIGAEGKTTEAWALFLSKNKSWEDIQGGVRKLAEKSIEDAKKQNEENQADAKKATVIIVLIALLAGVLAIVLGLYISNLIVNPLKIMVKLAEGMAQGDLRNLDRKFIRKDELGQLADALVAMRTSLRDLMQQVSVNAEQVAASSEELTASAEQSAQASNQIASSINDVANGANEQLIASDATSAIVEQISAGIQQVAANISHIAEQSTHATEKAQTGGDTVEKAVRQMVNIEDTVNNSAQVVTKLGERSKEIGQIVETISGIAGQTNLLALNAAIEAARAGEQGRGFAVVAEEVRKLAEQSQEAAKKIAELIGEIQVDTDKAVVAMNDGTREVKNGAVIVNAAGASFQEIVELVSRVSSQMREISAAIQQMANGSQQIVESVKKIDNLSKTAASEAQTVSAATEEQLASMEEIASSSEALSKLAQELQSGVAKFRL